MDVIEKKDEHYVTRGGKIFRGILYWCNPEGGEFFTLKYDGAEIFVARGEIYKIELPSPRGIVQFNLRLWLLKLHRIVKQTANI